jgi:predicted RNA-binding protein with PUA-like domain
MAAGHWLMKSEPDAFGIADLERVRVEPWTGVRNYQARNHMRDGMKVGDAVLFYHSNAEPSGVAGLARVVRTGVVDVTQFDPESKYYDPGSTRADPRWICVDVEYVETLPRLVALDELRANPALADMLLLRRGMRLSVMPVSAAHYRAVVAMARRAAPAAVSPKRAGIAAPRPQRPTKPAGAAAKRPPRARKRGRG